LHKSLLYYHDIHILKRTPIELYHYASFYKSAGPVIHFVSHYEASTLSGESNLKDLPYPDFLKPYPCPQKVVEEKQDVKKRKEKPVAASSRGKQSSARVSLKTAKKPLDQTPPLIHLKEAEEKEEMIDQSVENMPLFPVLSLRNEVIEASSSTTPQVQEFLSPNLKTIDRASDVKPILKGRASKIHSDIFDAKAFSNTTFSKFQTLWETIGGTLKGKKSGGSHRSILLNGQVIGGTFVPHGGHGYGKRCINNLRDALTLAGYGKDYLAY